MNKTSIIAATILGVSLIICAFTLSSAIKKHGGSIERAALHNRTEIPTSLRIMHEAGRTPVRVDQK